MEKSPAPIPHDLKKVSRIFHRSGYQCWLVGGAIRNGLLGRETDDFDLATDAEPGETAKLFHRTIPTGIKHGTITIIMGSHQFETTTFRSDGHYSDGRRPDKVAYSKSIIADLARRDFTINAIAWDLINHRILDLHNGRNDLKQRVIRAIGDPVRRFDEDALRIIRACRLSAQLGFTVTSETLKAINPDSIRSLSAERVWDELRKILRTPTPSTAFQLFIKTGLLKVLFPEFHADDSHLPFSFEKNTDVFDTVPSHRYHVRAALLFYNEKKSAGENKATAAKILKRFKASNADIDKISRLISNHELQYENSWPDSKVRCFIRQIGSDILDDLLLLHKTIAEYHENDSSHQIELLEELHGRIQIIHERKDPLTIQDLDINGFILMEELDLPSSPIIGRLLNYLLTCVMEDTTTNRRHLLMDMARKWLKN